MRVNCITVIFFWLLSMPIFAQTIFGKWKNKNEDTGKVDSVIEIFEKDGKAYGKIIEILNPDRKDAICDKCPGSYKNKPILGLEILRDFKKKEDQWEDGKILDPKKGKIYDCYLELESSNKLKIRGFIGFSILGRTAYWYR